MSLAKEAVPVALVGGDAVAREDRTPTNEAPLTLPDGRKGHIEGWHDEARRLREHLIYTLIQHEHMATIGGHMGVAAEAKNTLRALGAKT